MQVGGREVPGDEVVDNAAVVGRSGGEQLVEFAIMGAAFHHAVHGSARPTVGLLNVGSEEEKGHDEVRGAHALLRATTFDLDYRGFVEGNDIPGGKVDVVVTDGFTGNVALKTVEGTAKLMAHFMRQSFKSSMMAKFGYIFARGAMRRMRQRIDPRRYNGAMFVGLEGVCVKSHGGADHEGFANAISVAADLATQKFNEKIKAELVRHYEALESAEPVEFIDVAVGEE